MPEFETHPGLPVPLVLAGPRPSLARNASTALFISQLWAAAHRLPPQRRRYMASMDLALGAYGQSVSLTHRRMPQGFRKTVVA